MDDALVLANQLQLNPQAALVLILVVMDDALVLANQLQLNPQAALVLILVVMDDALVLSTTLLRKTIRLQRLNPCCNG